MAAAKASTHGHICGSQQVVRMSVLRSVLLEVLRYIHSLKKEFQCLSVNCASALRVACLAWHRSSVHNRSSDAAAIALRVDIRSCMFVPGEKPTTMCVPVATVVPVTCAREVVGASDRQQAPA